MEELGYLWNYQENLDELKLKLQYSSIELESVKMEANEQIRKYKEELKLMVNLLNLAYQERDEARDQLQKLLNKFMPCPPPQPETPLMVAAKTNSSITESNSLSHGSPPVDSFFDAVTSPDFPTIKMPADSTGMGLLNNQPLVQNGCGFVPSMVSPKPDGETAVIDKLAKGKTLPEKGKLLQAVMEARPLLQTLLLAGPLPQWRNPPPSNTFKIPPVSLNGCDSKPVVTPKRVNSSRYLEMSRGTRQMCSTAMLSFASSGAGAGAGVNNQITVTKRQRFQ
ncbi:uncharacterized protein LOC108463448 [Gossypium arboreum]|uniref:Uncharacterized protein n=1 Tax=Gossypium arboreum TaxID=29729 RepID=A0ABR0R5L5_GOSAR|nr:uncharacterized protein LOC108463448 [Gossypium arboreum]KAK5846811.1 hypothetical protein PVK06_003110 [Gossypium arboreum]